MRNVIVLGAGMVGSAMAIDMAKKHRVTLTDLSQDVLSNAKQKCSDLIVQKLDVTNKESEIPIIAKRIPDVPGTHSVEYKSTVDTIDIKHTAHSRDGFALGAAIASEWLVGKNGIFTMRDVLGLK